MARPESDEGVAKIGGTVAAALVSGHATSPASRGCKRRNGIGSIGGASGAEVGFRGRFILFGLQEGFDGEWWVVDTRRDRFFKCYCSLVNGDVYLFKYKI